MDKKAKAPSNSLKTPDLISQTLANHFAAQIGDWQMRIMQGWGEIAGELSKQARVEKIIKDTLVLGVYDTCWMQELHLLSSVICQKVNQYIGQKQIRQIRVKYVQKHVFRPLLAKPINNNPQINLTSPELQTLKNIIDPELRSAIQSFWIRCRCEQN